MDDTPITPEEDPPSPFDEYVRSLEPTRKSDPLVALSVKVPVSIAKALEFVVFQAKMKGRRITKQQIVRDALVEYLGLSKPEKQLTAGDDES